MTYADFESAPVDSEVVIESYVQAKQAWENGTATIYTQDMDGAYFIYSMPITREGYDALLPGSKIRVTGYKSEQSGELEIVNASYGIVEGEPFIAEAVDVTDLLGTDELIQYQNKRVSFKGMTVEPKTIPGVDGEFAFLYNWDGSGQPGSDLYFDVSVNDQTYTFTVESSLCGEDSDVYKTVTALHIGDVINLEGFLYWSDGAAPHIINVKAAE